jgi:hypothetical protein
MHNLLIGTDSRRDRRPLNQVGMAVSKL